MADLYTLVHSEFNQLEQSKKAIKTKVLSFLDNPNLKHENNHVSHIKNHKPHDTQKENFFSQYQYVLILLNDANSIKEFSNELKKSIETQKYYIFNDSYKYHPEVLQNLKSLF